MKPGTYTPQQFIQQAKLGGGLEFRGYVAYDTQHPDKVLFGVDSCTFPSEVIDEAHILSIDLGCPHFFPKDYTKKAWEATVHLDETKAPLALQVKLLKLALAAQYANQGTSSASSYGLCANSYARGYSFAHRYRTSCC